MVVSDEGFLPLAVVENTTRGSDRVIIPALSSQLLLLQEVV
jgi:hypothetical protein